MTAELYAQLAQAANAKKLAKNRLNPYEPEFYGIQDSPMEHILNDEPQRYIPDTLDEEADLNFNVKKIANSVYDASQPYGFQFGGEHAWRLENDASDRYYDPNWSGPHAFDVADPEDPYEGGEVFVGNGDRVAQPGEEGFIGDAKNALMPIVQTAGSYVLPMLFSMLMRGGK